MTESQWFASTSPHEMLAYLKESRSSGLSALFAWLRPRGGPSERKMRLFACACCRRVWPLLTDARSKQAVEIAERHADGLAGKKELRAAAELARAAYLDSARPQVTVGGWFAAASARAAEAVVLALPADDAATCSKEAVRAWATHVPRNEPINPMQRPRLAFPPVSPEAAWIAEGNAQCELLRDLIGNPLHPPTLLPSWRTPQVLELAKGLFQENSFADLSGLATALEHAGCKNPEVLHHCTHHHEHARGCWVVDFILDKS
jgi:hypothetical protein